jgi:hypothetical protein
MEIYLVSTDKGSAIDESIGSRLIWVIFNHMQTTFAEEQSSEMKNDRQVYFSGGFGHKPIATKSVKPVPYVGNVWIRLTVLLIAYFSVIYCAK